MHSLFYLSLSVFKFDKYKYLICSNLNDRVNTQAIKKTTIGHPNLVVLTSSKSFNQATRKCVFCLVVCGYRHSSHLAVEKQNSITFFPPFLSFPLVSGRFISVHSERDAFWRSTQSGGTRLFRVFPLPIINVHLSVRNIFLSLLVGIHFGTCSKSSLFPFQKKTNIKTNNPKKTLKKFDVVFTRVIDERSRYYV